MQGIGRSLRAVWVILKHDFNLYFQSPIVYLIGAVWLFLAGGFFSLSLSYINQGVMEPSIQSMLDPMVFLMIFIAPALTMRLVSEELRAGTHELLFTAPVRDWEVIVGKWLAVWAVFSIFILLTAPMPFILVMRGNPDQGLILTGYLGLWLMGGATLAIGVLASSLTQYQLIAFMISLGTFVFLWVAQGVTQFINNETLLDVFSEISFIPHYQNLIDRAIIDPVDIAYFVGMIAIALFLATQMLSTRRWST
jgi:ABC-2 type transport system permease protein